MTILTSLEAWQDTKQRQFCSQQSIFQKAESEENLSPKKQEKLLPQHL